jgi:hypothetical protein
MSGLVSPERPETAAIMLAAKATLKYWPIAAILQKKCIID